MGKQDRKEAARKAREAARLQDKKLNKLMTTPKRKLNIPKPTDPKGWNLESSPE